MKKDAEKEVDEKSLIQRRHLRGLSEDSSLFQEFFEDVSEEEDLFQEMRRVKEEREYLEREIERLKSRIMSLSEELSRLKSPPQVVGTVVEVLEGRRVIVSTPGGPTFVVRVSKYVPFEGLTRGTKVSMTRDTMTIIDILPSAKDPMVGAMEVVERPQVSFEVIGGLRKQIEELKEVVELPLKRPDIFRRVGVDPPKGVLLAGPPGCGKTMLAQAIARETSATFIRLVGSELVQKYIGEGARLVRELFQLAREKAPSIVFLDELDAIAHRREDETTSADREVQRTLMQLLAEMDGFDTLGNVRIIGATNRPEVLDRAILRPGRIDRVIWIPLPDETGREEILKIYLKRMNLSRDVNMERLVHLTDGFSGADIKALCTEAGMMAIRRRRYKVRMKDFQDAVLKIKDSGDVFTSIGKGRLGDVPAGMYR
ncbi:MAG: proteasome-activating nucleotidase [Thermoplasmata archaeon]|nr:proteasome-activating nucleotidase [Thermoplasmata archaeon]